MEIKGEIIRKKYYKLKCGGKKRKSNQNYVWNWRRIREEEQVVLISSN
jgi:hypothetical protein